MASSLVSSACTSGPLAPGPRPGGGAGLGFEVELEVLVLALAVVDGAAVEVSRDAAPWAAPEAVVRCVVDPLQPAKPRATKAAASANLARVCTAGKTPPGRSGKAHSMEDGPARDEL